MLKRFIDDESAATAIEYGLIAVIISLAILIGAGGIAVEVRQNCQNTAEKVQEASER